MIDDILNRLKNLYLKREFIDEDEFNNELKILIEEFKRAE